MNTQFQGWKRVKSAPPTADGRKGGKAFRGHLALGVLAGLLGTGCSGGGAFDPTEPVMKPRKPYVAQGGARQTSPKTGTSSTQTKASSGVAVASADATTSADAMPTVSPVTPVATATPVKPVVAVPTTRPLPEPVPTVTPPDNRVVSAPPVATPPVAIPPVAAPSVAETPAAAGKSVDLDPNPRPRNPLARIDAGVSPAAVPSTNVEATTVSQSPTLAVTPAPTPAAADQGSPVAVEPTTAKPDIGPIQAAPYNPAPQATVAPAVAVAKPVDPETQKIRDRLAQVRSELEKGRDVNEKDDNGRTLLQQAALAGEQAVVELLLDWGASVKAVDRQGWTALHWAASSGHPEICELLIACGTPVDSRGFLDETPLYWASVFDRQHAVELLLARGAKVNAADKRGKSPLHAAVEGDARATATILLAQGADVAARDESGLTPLHQVVFRLRKTLLGLAEEPSTEATSTSGSPAAEVALERDHQRKLAITSAREMARLLLSQGADVNASTAAGVTPLHLAAWDDTKEIADVLIAAGAKVSAKDSRGRTPGDYASQRGQKRVLPLLAAKAR
ncbi:ankyrin repeat domain-containing protein [Humisphaera borealis]|uniref:Ankyrin repeat domain-containing protein n=1 Tax=Humisphaera borealis TaxID=2807512 RepID=A0A7M2WPC9_9BACT|nr:ankyrin repeat domain-containing protein [Humisphaera borealis]QOV87387.1 ankyrin repeat domain-containing protein [Humisphaera borealis]